MRINESQDLSGQREEDGDTEYLKDKLEYEVIGPCWIAQFMWRHCSWKVWRESPEGLDYDFGLIVHVLFQQIYG